MSCDCDRLRAELDAERAKREWVFAAFEVSLRATRTLRSKIEEERALVSVRELERDEAQHKANVIGDHTKRLEAELAEERAKLLAANLLCNEHVAYTMYEGEKHRADRCEKAMQSAIQRAEKAERERDAAIVGLTVECERVAELRAVADAVSKERDNLRHLMNECLSEAERLGLVRGTESLRQWIGGYVATLNSRAETAERERDEARAEVSREIARFHDAIMQNVGLGKDRDAIRAERDDLRAKLAACVAALEALTDDTNDEAAWHNACRVLAAAKGDA